MIEAEWVELRITRYRCPAGHEVERAAPVAVEPALRLICCTARETADGAPTLCYKLAQLISWRLADEPVASAPEAT